MSVAIDISALPRDKKFYVTLQDDFGTFRHGPCRVDKEGRVGFIDDQGKSTLIRTDLPIVAYEIIEESKQPWEAP